MKVLVAGGGKSGKAVLTLLKNQGQNAEIVDDEVLNFCPQSQKNINFDRLFSGLSFIVKSPGLSFDLPFFKEAKKRKIKVVGELEYASGFVQGDIIAVTGTNGKTTTVSLMFHILSGLMSNVFLGGNVGVPVSSFASQTQKGDIVILECSSFQLEKIKNFKPHIACILNVTPDHLNRHKTMKNYLDCKWNIAKKLTENDYLIVNADDENLMKNLKNTKAKIFFFSTKKQVVGCYVKRNSIYFNDNFSEVRLLSLSKFKLVGEHNISNLLCACLAIFLQTKSKIILENAYTFLGVEHRIEYVKTIKNIAFYNDSKATNTDSSMVAIKSFKCGINLILGGSDKGCDFDDFFKNLPKNVTNIALFGETKHKIAFFAEKNNFKNYTIFDNLKACVWWCYSKSKPNEIVLLSPACASFDCFKSYEERGSIFKKIVEEIFKNETAESKSSKTTQV